MKDNERKKKEISTARSISHDLTSQVCCYRCSTLFNCNMYACNGAFFDLIEWLKVLFFDL